VTRALRLGHLYPLAMTIYGDAGNVRALRRRAEWRGMELEVVPIEAGPADLENCDLLLIGGGQDRDQSAVFADLAAHKRESLARAVAGGAAVLAVCGGYQLLGHDYVDARGRVLEGLALLDLRSRAGDDRWIGNVIVEADPGMGLGEPRLVGFENHGGRTHLGPGLRPLGRVVVGGGNNGADGGEGVVAGRVVGTYLHGSLLPKNPALADWLLAAAVAHRDGLADPPTLPPLDDTLELAAHGRAVEIALAERGRGPVPRPRGGRLT
jgi:lipid II isoglutaminyl synthase (glutamine-hydrolysing)